MVWIAAILALSGCAGLDKSAPATRITSAEPIRLQFSATGWTTVEVEGWTVVSVDGRKAWAGTEIWTGYGCIAHLQQRDTVNGAYAAILPVSKARAKDLLVDAATPLGFRFDAHLSDEVVALTRTVDRAAILNHRPEGHLFARFSERPAGTEVYINTDSLELVMKSRDSSHAGGIVRYMMCLNRLLDHDPDNPLRPAPFDGTTATGKPIVELLSMRVLSSRTARAGQSIHYRVKQDVFIKGERVIARGAPATGRVVSARAAGFAGGGKLRIALDRVQDVDGHWRALHFANGRDAIQMGVENDMRGAVLPLEQAPAMSAGGQPALAAGTIVRSRLVDAPVLR
ncbi:hypothetical protein O4G98_19795 [Zoogloeaceae bacterium G21618-S1]|nr:hypothetical protein [Zoogloeaceae bacterium G21618-S1]